MRNNDHAVLGDSHVEFERVDAHRQRIGEGWQRVLRAQRAPAAMRFDVEGCGARGPCTGETVLRKSGHNR